MDLKEKMNYWKQRCEAAEALLKEADIKPDDRDKKLTRLYCSWIGFKYDKNITYGKT